MKRTPKFKPGDVVLMHMPDEDQDPNDWVNDEVGEIEGAEGWDHDLNEPEDMEEWTEYPDHAIMYIVTVPAEFRKKGDNDGIREVDESQLSHYKPVGKKRKS
jgi:hypothetical protein